MAAKPKRAFKISACISTYIYLMIVVSILTFFREHYFELVLAVISDSYIVCNILFYKKKYVLL